MYRIVAALCILFGASIAPAQMTVSPLLNISGLSDSIQYAQPASGVTVSVAQGTSALVVDNSSLLLALTVTLPANPTDGQRIVIVSGAGITALIVNGGTVKGLITSLGVNGYARFIYSAGAGAWFRSG